MIRHVWTVACAHAVVDQDSKLVSMFDVIEQINIPGQPTDDQAIGMSIDLVSLWVRTDPQQSGKGRARITFNAPSGKVLHEINQDIDLSNHERLRSKGRFTPVPVPEDGVYCFRVEYSPINVDEWVEVASVPLKVSFVPEEKAAEAVSR